MIVLSGCQKQLQENPYSQLIPENFLTTKNGIKSVLYAAYTEVRERAGLKDIALSDYLTKNSLRDRILAEREWEFYSEGKRREDLLRMGKFISNAQARGKNAKPFQKFFPIPQQAMDSNPKLVQNTGY